MNIFVGILMSLLHGAVMPAFAIFLAKVLFTLTLFSADIIGKEGEAYDAVKNASEHTSRL